MTTHVEERMDNKKPKPKNRTEAEIREERLKAALKANMAKRKAQAKLRAQKSSDTDKG